MGIATLGMLALSLAAEVPSDGSAIASISGWSLFDNKGSCAALTAYEGNTMFRVSYDFSDGTVQLTLTDPAWKSVAAGTEYKVRILFTNGDEWTDATGFGFVLDDGARGLAFFLKGDDFLDAFARSQAVGLSMGDTKLGAFNLKGTQAVVPRLRACAIASYKRYPPDPFAKVTTKTFASAPKPVSSIHTLFSADDYPPSAIRLGQEGRVVAQVSIGSDGRITSCTITKSSGSTALDDATCRIAQRRARYTPAKDSTGSPVPSLDSISVNWTLPAPEPVAPSPTME